MSSRKETRGRSLLSILGNFLGTNTRGSKIAAPSTSHADIFWDSDNRDIQQSSIGEILNYELNNGCLAVGAEFQIQRAVRLPDVWVKVTAVPEYGEIDYVVIKGGE